MAGNVYYHGDIEQNHGVYKIKGNVTMSSSSSLPNFGVTQSPTRIIPVPVPVRPSCTPGFPHAHPHPHVFAHPHPHMHMHPTGQGCPGFAPTMGMGMGPGGMGMGMGMGMNMNMAGFPANANPAAMPAFPPGMAAFPAQFPLGPYQPDIDLHLDEDNANEGMPGPDARVWKRGSRRSTTSRASSRRKTRTPGCVRSPSTCTSVHTHADESDDERRSASPSSRSSQRSTPRRVRPRIDPPSEASSSNGHVEDNKEASETPASTEFLEDEEDLDYVDMKLESVESD